MKPDIMRLLVLLTLFFLGACNEKEQISNSGFGAFEASLAIQGDKIGVAWYDKRNGAAEIYFRLLDQNLKPVSKELRLTQNNAESYEADLVFIDDTFAITWYEKDKNDALSVKLGLWNLEGIQLWQKEISSGDHDSRIPVLKVINQEIFIAWIEDPVDKQSSALPSIIYGARLNVDGNFINQPYKIAEASRTTWNLNANVTKDLEVVLVFDAEYETSTSELYLSRVLANSHDTIRLTTDDGKASKYPDIALNDSLAALTWFDAKPGNNEIYLNIFDLNLLLMDGFEITPLLDNSAQRITHTEGDSIGAYLSWNKNILGLAWSDNDAGQHEIFFQAFTPEGNTLSEIVRLTKTATDSLIPSIRPLNKGFAMAWNEASIDSHSSGKPDTSSEVFARYLPASNNLRSISVEQTLYLEAINNPERWDEDRKRDAISKPLKILSLMAVKPGMSVLDFQAGTGYFTELLSTVVGSQGKIFAHNHSREGVLGEEVFIRRYGNNRLSNTEQIFSHHNDLNLAAESLDSILMSMVYHDTYWFNGHVDWGPVDHQKFLLELYGALKPGGIILLIDHAGKKGGDPFQSAVATHRIDPELVKRDFELAGFTLELESMILRSSKDNYGLSIFDEEVYGKTDRFIMVFRKP